MTFGAEAEFENTGNITAVAVAFGSKLAVAYRDGSNSDHGTAKIGAIPFAASLTASTPAAYGSAAAATKMAFVGWMKNPSA